MVVTRAPGSNDKPMVRIRNRLLTEAGFEIGVSVEVVYNQDLITIRKINKNNEYKLQNPSHQIAIPTASGEGSPRKGNEHAGRRESGPADASEAMPTSIQSISDILAGYCNYGDPQNTWSCRSEM